MVHFGAFPFLSPSSQKEGKETVGEDGAHPESEHCHLPGGPHGGHHAAVPHPHTVTDEPHISGG